jgi:hypothetical protein
MPQTQETHFEGKRTSKQCSNCDWYKLISLLSTPLSRGRKERQHLVSPLVSLSSLIVITHCHHSLSSLIVITAHAFLDHPSLKSLDLSGNQISATGGKALLELLQTNRSIKELDFSKNRIDVQIRLKLTVCSLIFTIISSNHFFIIQLSFLCFMMSHIPVVVFALQAELETSRRME